MSTPLTTAALHADIFGESDSDDDEYVPPTHAADDDDGDDRVDAILESGRVNNLLLGKKDKEKKKREKRSSGKGKEKAEGKRKRKDKSDEGRGKRLRRGGDGGDGGGGGGGEGEGEAGSSGAGVNNDADDPDEDSGSGSEAVEEGGKNDFDKILDGLKHKRSKGPSQSFDVICDEVMALQERMEAAVESDDLAGKRDQPGGARPQLAKIAMLPEVENMIRKKHYHEALMMKGIFGTLARWLRPAEDGSLVSLQVRAGLLKALMRFEVDETIIGSLKSSGIGKYVKLLTLHKRELPENKRIAQALIEKWSRPIFATSDKVHAADIPTALPPSVMPDRSRDEPGTLGGALAKDGMGQTANHARVPRPMGMDFTVAAASTAAPLPSSRYAKESVKGRLQDRILNGKKRPKTQAVQMSVEGRTIDRL